MRIEAINIYQHDIAVADGLYEMSISEVATLDTTVVEIITDTGLRGYGETCPLGPTYQPQHAAGARAGIAEVSPTLIGLDPRHLVQINAAMEGALNGSLYAKAPLDIACWDIAAKAAGVRVCDLLGGPFTEQVPSYYGVMPDTPENMAARAAELQLAGFSRLQIKVGARSVAEDIETLRLVHEALRPGLKLRADANRGFTMREAINFSEGTRDIPLSLEQPCSTFEENASLRGRVRHPVFLDESAVDLSTVLRAVDSGVADGFGLKVTRVGGLSNLRTIRDVCASRHIPHSCDDTWGGPITNATCAHIGSTVAPRTFEGTWIADSYTASSYAVKTPRLTNPNGFIQLPTGLGLGVEPDLDEWPDPLMTFS